MVPTGVVEGGAAGVLERLFAGLDQRLFADDTEAAYFLQSGSGLSDDDPVARDELRRHLAGIARW
jgi:hypothetical protein